MAAATAGCSLSIEVDEDMLVENAASAPTLFSPGMWVQRPTRTPATAAAEGRHRLISACGSPGAQLLPMPMSAFPQAPPYAPTTTSPAGTAAGASLGAAPRAGTPSSPGLEADPDLAYLSVADDRERERAEREYLQQDSEHMAALEEAYARLRDQNGAMEQQLQGVALAVSDVMDENRTIKQLLGMLKVRREDFVFNQHQTIGAQQEAIGMRLLQNVEEEEEDSPIPSGQHAQPPAALQQRQRAGSGAVPLHVQQQQLQQQQQQQQCSQGEQRQRQQAPALELGLAAPAFDASPGGMLPMGTPSMMLRTVSPKIAAFRGCGATDMLMDDANELVAPNTVPATPQEFPAEAQIAAAALTAKQGDTAAALLTLLDKAIEGRLERQQHAAAQAAEQALMQQAQEQQRQQRAQQQQQAMY